MPEYVATSTDTWSLPKGLGFPGREFLIRIQQFWPVFWVVLFLQVTPILAADSVPPDFADLSERLLPSVVNIATTQEIQIGPGQAVPQFPPGSPFEEFLWRISRVLSFLVFLIESIVIYSIFNNELFQISQNQYFRQEIIYAIIIFSPIVILIIFNFLSFGRASIWIKKR